MPALPTTFARRCPDCKAELVLQRSAATADYRGRCDRCGAVQIVPIYALPADLLAEVAGPHPAAVPEGEAWVRAMAAAGQPAVDRLRAALRDGDPELEGDGEGAQ